MSGRPRRRGLPSSLPALILILGMLAVLGISFLAIRMLSEDESGQPLDPTQEQFSEVTGLSPEDDPLDIEQEASAAGDDEAAAEPIGAGTRFGHGITGRVVDPGGEPIVGAQLRLMVDESLLDDLMIDVDMWWANDHGRSFTLLPRATTDEEGRFDLDRWTYLDEDPEAQGGSCLMLVSAPGRITQFVRARPNRSGQVPAIMLAPSSPLRGRFVDSSERPQPGVHLCIMVEWRDDLPDWDDDVEGLNETLQLAYCTDSGDDGRFEIEGLGPGSVIVELSRPLGGDEWMEDVPLQPGQPTDVGDYVLEEGEVIAGQVVDEMGQPVADALVILTGVDEDGLEQMEYDLPWTVEGVVGHVGHGSRHSGAEGRFEFVGIEDDSGSLLVLADGFEPLAISDVEAGDEEVRVVLGRPARLLVSVTDAATGAPLVNARVQATRHPGYTSWMEDEPRILPVHHGDVALQLAGVDGSGQGRALVEGLGHRENAIEISAPGWERKVIPWLGAEPGGVEFVDVSLERGGTILGVVRGVDDQPLFDAWVHARPQGRGEFSDWLPNERWTGTDGAFRFDGLRPGTWMLSARSDRVVTHAIVEMGPGQRHEVDLWVIPPIQPPATAQLRGALLAGGGRPLAGRPVKLHRHDGDRWLPTLRSTATDGSGDFTFEELRAGEYRVVSAGLAEARVELPEGGTVHVVLEAAARATLQGQVLFDGTGAESQVSLIGISPPERAVASTRTAEDGSYLIDCRQDGRFLLRAMSLSGGAIAQLDVSLALDGTTLQDIVLRGGSNVVRGLVLDALDGQPVEGSLVTLTKLGASRELASSLLREDGQFEFSGVLPGRHQIEIPHGRYRGRWTHEVPEIGALDVVLRALPRAQLSGVVRREIGWPEGEPLVVRAVALQDLTPFGLANSYSTRTKLDRFVFEKLPAARYRIETAAWDVEQGRAVALPDHLRALMPVVTVGSSRFMRVGLVAPTIY